MNDALELTLAVILGITLGALVSGGCVMDYYRDEAVRHGAAEYYIDKNFEKKWRWKNDHHH